MDRTYSILVVEDDHEMRNLLRDGLWGEGYQLNEVRDGYEALRAVLRTVPDLILTEVHIPSGGVEYISRLRAVAPGCPIVVMTAFRDERLREAVQRAGGTISMMKPVHLTELRSCLRALVGPIHQSIK
jgi:DNA-binding response OmpR family regulator